MLYFAPLYNYLKVLDMKKLFRKSGLGIIALVIASSCAKDDVFVQNNDDAINFNESPYAVSEMEAKEVLASFMNQFDSNLSGEVSTKSGSIRTIKDVQTFPVDKEMIMDYATEAELDIDLSDVDKLMYIANFEDNQGFAIVSADKRTTPVLAIIDEGSLPVDAISEIDNPGFLIFMEFAVNLQLRQIEASKGEVVATYASTSGLSDMVKTRATMLTNIPARLKTRWGQNCLPYNYYTPSHHPTGCVITACAQALSHFQTIGSVSWSYNATSGYAVLNWSQIIADSESTATADYGQLPNSTPVLFSSSDQVAHLMRFLGVSLNADYSSSGTSANSGTAVSFLKNWCGLTSSTGLNSYNVNNVRNGLVNSNTSLVYTSACAKKKKVLGITVGYTGCHAWILDGVQQIYYSANDTRNYVHCNWGWNGLCDGFFISDGFDTTVNPPILGPNDNGGTIHYKYINENKYAILNY
jgi:hypothetical protein